MFWLRLFVLLLSVLPAPRVVGTVVDSKGVPVAGARIELNRGHHHDAQPLGGEENLYLAITGTDGRFEVTGVPPGRFSLEVRADGFAPLRSPGLHLPTGGGKTVDAGTLTLQRGAALTGRVSDSGGQPVPGAEVWLVPYEMRDADLDWSGYYKKGPAARTDADGAFEIADLDPGKPVDLDVCRSGYLPVSLYFHAAPENPVEAVLEPAARLSGRVLDPERAPVDGAQVRAWISGEYPDDPRGARPCFHETGSARTGADGRFAFDTLRPGWWTVRASARDWPSADSERRMIRSGESTEELEIVLPGRPADAEIEAAPGENRLDPTLEPDDRREVRGRVVGPDGEPVPGAEVWGGSEAATSAADGSFVLRLEDGEHRLTADREGYGPVNRKVSVEGGPVEGIVLSLPRAGSIRGRLLGLSPEALANAWVEVRVTDNKSRKSRADLQGAYLLDGVPSGSWKVSAWSGTRSAEGRVELEAGEAFLDLSFKQAWEVSGRMTGPDGEPLAGGSVEARDSEYRGMHTVTLPDGSFRLELEEGTYVLRVRWRDLYSARGTLQVRVAGASVTGIEIPMKREATLRGRLLGLEPGELAWQIRADGPKGRVAFGYVDQEARFTIPMLFPGTWTVTARHGDRVATGRVTFAEGQDEAFLDIAFEGE